MTQVQTLPKITSIDRISKIPVVETGFGYASGVYFKLKRSNSLVSWSLDTVEGQLQNVMAKSLPVLELPISVVDVLVCKTLDEVETRVPAINLPTDQLFNLTKDLVSTNIVQPVLKRADSVKQFSVNNPRISKYGELAATRIDTALDRADEYVDKYLPDSSDADQKNDQLNSDESKTQRAIHHANRFSKKLQRRLTRRTIAEAQALRKTGHNIAQFVVFSIELLMKDPKEFAKKMRQIWAHLSEDEPENQIPPSNLDQLLALVARETARWIVHVANYSAAVGANLPNNIAHLVNTANHQAVVLLNTMIKIAHLEGIRGAVVGRTEVEFHKILTRLNELYKLIRNSLERSKSVSIVELHPIACSNEPKDTPASPKAPSQASNPTSGQTPEPTPSAPASSSPAKNKSKKEKKEMKQNGSAEQPNQSP